MAWKLFETGPGDENEIDAEDDFQRVDPSANYLLPHSRLLQIDPIGGDVAPARGGRFARGFGAAVRGAPSASPRAQGLIGLLKQLTGEPPLTGAARTPSNAAPSMRSNIAPSWDPARPFAVQAGLPPRLRSPGGNVGIPSQALGASAHNDPNFRRLSRMPSGIADQMDNQPDRSHGQFGSNDFHDPTGASAPNIAEIGARSPANADAEAGATTSAATSIRRGPMSPIPSPNAPPWLPWGSESFELPRTLYGDASSWGGGGGGGGGGRGGRRRRGRRPSKYDRCISAAPGEVEDWNAFCRTLPEGGRSKTVGGETPKRACWSKAYESENQKRGFCQNEFGNNG